MEVEQILIELTTREALLLSLQAEQYFWFAPGDVIVEDGEVYAYIKCGNVIARARFIVDGENVTYAGMEN